MAIDDKVCPHCGHGVLNWDVVCPGCDMIPRETPEGKRAENLWRLKLLLIDDWPTLAGVLFVLVVVGLWFWPGGESKGPVAAVPQTGTPAAPAPESDAVVASRRMGKTDTTAELYASGKVVVKGLLPLAQFPQGMTFPDLDSVQPTIEAIRRSPHAPPAVAGGPTVDWLLKTAVPDLKKEKAKSP